MSPNMGTSRQCLHDGFLAAAGGPPAEWADTACIEFTGDRFHWYLEEASSPPFSYTLEFDNGETVAMPDEYATFQEYVKTGLGPGRHYVRLIGYNNTFANWSDPRNYSPEWDWSNIVAIHNLPKWPSYGGFVTQSKLHIGAFPFASMSLQAGPTDPLVELELPMACQDAVIDLPQTAYTSLSVNAFDGSDTPIALQSITARVAGLYIAMATSLNPVDVDLQQPDYYSQFTYIRNCSWSSLQVDDFFIRFDNFAWTSTVPGGTVDLSNNANQGYFNANATSGSDAARASLIAKGYTCTYA